MGVSLSKGQKVSLEKSTGEKLDKFCVKVSWGAIKIEKKGFLRTKIEIADVDLDLSCILVDAGGELKDWLYSPEYNGWLQKNELPLGKLDTFDHALHHSGDDRGQGGGDDFSEAITVDLTKINFDIQQIFFFLNIYLNQGQSFDFSDIPFAKIQMYEGTPAHIDREHLNFDIATDSNFAGKQGLIMGKLFKDGGAWKFDAMGDPVDDEIFMQTIMRILKSLNG